MSFYAVRAGRVPGIYPTWAACKQQTDGFSGAIHKKFSTERDAQAFIEGAETAGGGSSPSKKDPAFYAVKKGRLGTQGIYTTWEECKEQIAGVPNAVYKKFPSMEQAQAFITGETLPVPVMEETDAIIVFADGACQNNGQENAKGAYAAVFPSHRELDTVRLLVGKQTNNRAEYSAFILAYELASKLNTEKMIHVYSDCSILVNLVHSLPRPLTGLANLDLVERIAEIVKEGRVRAFHVKAHSGKADFFSYWNNEVDRLAVSLF